MQGSELLQYVGNVKGCLHCLWCCLIPQVRTLLFI